MSKPQKPRPYSFQNYPNREDYESKMRIYEIAMGVWIASQPTKKG